MGKTYRNYLRAGICTGDNSDYYKRRRKMIRNIDNFNLRNLIANYDIEDVSDMYTPCNIPMPDPWNEPTDGTILIDKKGAINNFFWGNDYINKKFGKYFKNKHSDRHYNFKTKKLVW